MIGAHLYIVMQLVPGTELSDLIAEQGPLPVPWVAAIGAQICSVLAAAHAASLVHRDLKPGNLILTPTGVVKVLDFGVAGVLDADLPRLTITGDYLGTPTYLAAELGAGTEALRTLRDLLDASTGPERLDLRYQIAVITAGIGQVADALGHLESLLPDLRSVRGPDSAQVAEIQALIEHLRRLSGEN